MQKTREELGAVYTVLVTGFGWGVWKSAGQSRALRIVGSCRARRVEPNRRGVAETSILVTHQMRDAFYRATHEAVGANGRVQILKAAAPQPRHAQFIVLHDGRNPLEGTAAELRASSDTSLEPYLPVV